MRISRHRRAGDSVREHVKVYNQAGGLLAVLENAGDINYNLRHNDLWVAGFSLPSRDPNNEYCQVHNLVRIPEEGRDLGLYRIVGLPSADEVTRGGMISYRLEHVMVTLLDDLLFGYHEIGGPGVYTEDVIRYILDRQETARWVLGECDFHDEFSYKFENDRLLSALMSLGSVLSEEYTWVFDTSSNPWTVSLKRADSTAGCGIHYLRNLTGIEKEVDGTTLITRLYLLGYGEGVNQLTIRDVNGGLPYIDADTASIWGIKSDVFVDTRIEDAATLKARGLQLLEQVKMPYVSYTASAVDLAALTGDAWDTFMPGKLVRVMDGEHGINLEARIVDIGKADQSGRPGDIQIIIANAPRDAAGSINSLADRVGIGELYSQGATNLYAQQFADNADPTHPARMRVYVPSSCVRINKMLLSWSIENFRAYETAAAAGGGTAATTSGGGANTATSSAGGGSERTSSSAGSVTLTSDPSDTETRTSSEGWSQTGPADPVFTYVGGPTETETGGTGTTGIPSTDETGPSTALSTAADGAYETSAATGGTGGSSEISTQAAGTGATGLGGSHSHSVAAISDNAPTSDPGGHTHTGPSHLHTIESHTHTGPSHSHTGPAHVHTGPSHRHSWSDTSDGPSLNTTSSDDGSGGFHTHTMRSHTHSVSGDTSYAGTGNTGESGTGATGTAGTGATGGTALSTNNAGTGNTGSGGGHTHTFTVKAHSTQSTDDHTHTGPSHSHPMGHTHDLGSHTHIAPNHTHGMAHTHNLSQHTHAGPSHKHDIAIHQHDFPHTHDLGGHKHSLTIPAHSHTASIGGHSHSVTIPDHTHTISLEAHTHEVTLNDHTHGIVYGIYEGEQAGSLTLRVDGTEIPSEAISGDEMDIVAWLSKDDEGKILRGTWHLVEIIPNSLTRIEANLFVQTFIQSVGGGDY